MKGCPQTNSIGAYHDGELPESRRVEIESHLAGCSICTEELAELKQLSAMIEQQPVEAISSEFTGFLHDQVEQWSDVGVLRFAQLLVGVAAVLLIGVGGWLISMPDSSPPRANVWERAAMSQRPESGVETNSMRAAEWMLTELAVQR